MLDNRAKLDIEILQISHSVSYGSVALKSLQNDNIPELDLLVREAIQNSSDAALNSEEDFYSVSFNTGEFKPAEFNSFLSEAEDILNKKFPQNNDTFLEIRDTGTSGLTGGVRLSDIKNDDHGNFFKLIYDTGKKQENNTAGGNWGFGKSVYYRVGIGIVIYYSRIKSDNNYEDRLIITLIEDESKKGPDGRDATILNAVTEGYAGRAWWGVKGDSDELLPLTDKEQIQPILDVFGIKSFSQGETGTSIIIPYIDTQALLNNIIPVGDVDKEHEGDVRRTFRKMFLSDISDYLNLSVQRWYAPKLDNYELKKMNMKWLRVSINNDYICKNNMFPFFKMVQELYNVALFTANQQKYTSENYKQIETFDININNYFDAGNQIGCVSLLRLPETKFFEMQKVFSPFDLIGKFEDVDSTKEPIVMYARDLGMIINYETSGRWAKNLTGIGNQDEYLFAFFVPRTKKMIRTDLEIHEYAGMRLGEYLRRCEASDHMSWNDPVRMQIVQRICSNTVNKIKNRLKEESQENLESKTSKFSHKLGESLMPRIGYEGRRPSGGGGGSGTGPNGEKSHNNSFWIKSSSIEGNNVVIEFALKIEEENKDVPLCLMIDSEDSSGVKVDTWEKEIGTKFPVQILSCNINRIRSLDSDDWSIVDKICDNEHKLITTDKLMAELAFETDNTRNTKLKFISRNSGGLETEGEITLKTDDKKYQFTLYIGRP